MIGGIGTNSSCDDLVLEVFDGFLDILSRHWFDVICDEHPDDILTLPSASRTREDGVPSYNG